MSGIFESIVCPAGEGNPRNSEASLLELKDGRLLLAYSRFYGGSEDAASGDISGRISEDGGRSWSAIFTLRKNDGLQNVMSASLLRLASGRAAFMYLRKNGDSDLHAFLRTSGDDCRIWSEEVCCTPGEGYFVVNNDRLVQLASGRLLVPASWTADTARDGHYRAVVFYSDDWGLTWHTGGQRLDIPGRGAMEPGVIELTDGRVWMFLRTQLGHVWQSFSEDGGISWEAPSQSPVIAPESPSQVKRMPSGRLLMIFNHHPLARTPLTAAVSADEGASWSRFKNIEDNPAHGYSYPSILFVGDRCLLTYYLDTGGWNLSLKFRSLPWRWFEEGAG
ncbi:MAG: exo-alpha-sialidase [Armatimonadetes bacterium]|nr:exo-alpha-sialidase [Armatimonadota bacterium]